MTIMPTGPAPTLEELLLQAEMMRRGGQPIANMFQQQQQNPLLNWVNAAVADPYTPLNMDGTRPVASPIARPAPAPIRSVALPPSQTQAERVVGRMAPQMQAPSPYAFGQHSAPSPGLQALFANPNSALHKAPPAPPPAGGASPEGAPTLNGDIMRQQVQVMTGAKLTSAGRSAEHNKAVGGVPNSYHLYERGALAGDFTPAKGESMGQLYANIRRGLGPEWKVINEGDHVHVEPSAGSGGAIGAAAGAITGGTGLVNGFDPTYYNQAIGQVDAAMGEALKPQTFDVSLPARPEVPELVKTPPMDFTKQDEWLAKLKPEKDSKATQSAISRRGMFEGLAQGLAGTPEDAHWGKVLANVGAGMLAGRMAGDREVQARLDKFDEKMDQWEALNFANEKEKASLVYNAALKEVDQINNRNMLVFQNNIDDWKMKNNFTIQNGMFIKSTQTDKGVQVTTTPIRSIIAPQMLLQKAQIMSNMAGTANQATIAQQQVINGVIGQAAGIEYQQSKMNDPANMGVEQQVGSIANAVISSNAGADVFGDDNWANMQNEAKKAAIASGATPGTQQYQDVYLEDLSTSAIANMLETPAFVQQAQKLGPLLSATEAARRQRNTTESRSTRRGNTTERETVRY